MKETFARRFTWTWNTGRFGIHMLKVSDHLLLIDGDLSSFYAIIYTEIAIVKKVP